MPPLPLLPCFGLLWFPLDILKWPEDPCCYLGVPGIGRWGAADSSMGLTYPGAPPVENLACAPL